MRYASLILLIFFAIPLFARQAETTLPESKTIGTQVGSLPSDAATMATAIRTSYYHPDELAGFDCNVSINWQDFFAAMKVNVPAERLKAIQGLSVRSQAIRGKTANVTFDWSGSVMTGKEQLEDGLKEMLGGFYQMYWSLVASPPIETASGISKIDPLPDGGAKVYSSSQNTSLVITVDKEDAPTHYTLNSPLLNGTVNLRYVPTPKPVPGDVRRISSMDVSEQIGTSTINVKLNLDYQALDEFYVPAHVSYDLGVAYSLSIDFSGCSVTKRVTADKIK